MPDSPPDYTVVVPAFDEEALLPRTLASLREAMAASPLRGEVVVCDNNSSDGTAAAARAAGARVVFEPVNQISRARNAGAAAARGRWLVFVDADTTVPPPLLAEALQALESGRAVGGGSLLTIDGERGRGTALLERGWSAVSRVAGVAAGSFVFVRRDAFEAVGGFSGKVYAAEEIFLSRAVKRWGRRRGLPFLVLTAHPVVTSDRKLRWYSPWRLAATLLLLALCPFLARSRRFCSLWYDRPLRGGAAGAP